MINKEPIMKNQFEKYLLDCGYKEYTESGRKSTVYSYLNKIEEVLKWENLTWEELANKITKISKQYDIGGINEKIGASSHDTVINALKAFEKFVNNK